jgi:hypothetical protein
MKFWETLKHDWELIRMSVKPDETADRIWVCEPLLVIDDSDGSIAFKGVTNVDVHPNPDGTADLLAHESKDGWQPSLEQARIWTSSGGVPGLYSGVRPGLGCEGKDKQGNSFHWFVNSLADSYFAEHRPTWREDPVRSENSGGYIRPPRTK